jgi:hypothetical protein
MADNFIRVKQINQSELSGVVQNVINSNQYTITYNGGTGLSINNLSQINLSGVQLNILGPRPTVNGTGILLSGEVAGGGGTITGAVVYLTGNQTISGTKIFDSLRIEPSSKVYTLGTGLNINSESGIVRINTNLSSSYGAGFTYALNSGVDPNRPFDVEGRGRLVHGLQLDAGSNYFTSASDHFHFIFSAAPNNPGSYNGAYASNFGVNYKSYQYSPTTRPNGTDNERDLIHLTTLEAKGANDEVFPTSSLTELYLTTTGTLVVTPPGTGLVELAYSINNQANSQYLHATGDTVYLRVFPGVAGIVANTYNGTVVKRITGFDPGYGTTNVYKVGIALGALGFNNNFNSAQKGTSTQTDAWALSRNTTSSAFTGIKRIERTLSQFGDQFNVYYQAPITGYTGESVVVDVYNKGSGTFVTSGINLTQARYDGYVSKVLSTTGLEITLSIMNYGSLGGVGRPGAFHNPSLTTGVGSISSEDLVSGMQIYRGSSDAVHRNYWAHNVFAGFRNLDANELNVPAGVITRVAVGGLNRVESGSSSALGFNNKAYGFNSHAYGANQENYSRDSVKIGARENSFVKIVSGKVGINLEYPTESLHISGTNLKVENGTGIFGAVDLSNINDLSLSGTNVTITDGNVIVATNSATYIPLTYNPFSVVGSGNTYIQLNIQNKASGTAASSDLVITSNAGSDSTNYLDLGINNSGYNQADYNIGTSGDGYLYIHGGNLTIGTQTTGKVIKFHVDNTTSDKQVAEISTSGITSIRVNATSGIFGLESLVFGTYNGIGGGSGNFITGNFNYIGGGCKNSIGSGSACATSFIGGGGRNYIEGSTNTIAGGQTNCIINNVANRSFSFIGGGANNAIGHNQGVIGGGASNRVFNTLSAILGGSSNFISGINAANTCYNVIVGGCGNVISGTTPYGLFIGGGTKNCITGGFGWGAIGGGYRNCISNNSAFIGGGRSNCVQGSYSNVVGGRNNTALGNYSNLGGGVCNTIFDDASVIVGGVKNTGYFSGSAIVGGSNNIASGTNSFVGGGSCNCASRNYASVLGGLCNKSVGTCSNIGGGEFNCAFGNASTVAGGTSNIAIGIVSTVAGGDLNCTIGNFSFIGGGEFNCAAGAYSNIGGGCFNITRGDLSTVAGGYYNCAISLSSFVGGGKGNVATGIYSTIGGGYRNCAYGQTSFVGGGNNNKALPDYSNIVGGISNYIDGSGSFNIIGAGSCNRIFGDASAIFGGIQNTGYSSGSAIVGGSRNFVNGKESFIGGGFRNCLVQEYGFIGGGYKNYISGEPGQPLSIIVGGSFNSISGSYSFIGGGSNNYIITSQAFIGGGSSNSTIGCNSVVVGGTCNSIIGVNSNCALHSTIVGGCCNLIVNGNRSFIGGGYLNKTNTRCSVIVGGSTNLISGTNANIPAYTFIGGGFCSCITGSSTYSAINGGLCNSITCNSNLAFIGAGLANKLDNASYSVIGGGNTNTICNPGGIIGTCSFIGGGERNIITGAYNFIGAGFCNTIETERSVIVGGSNNYILSGTTSGSSIVGGQFNTISGEYSFIGGGNCNVLSGCYSTIGGGLANSISSISNGGTIGGGQCNFVNNFNATIGGGICNIANGARSTIGGGLCNTTLAIDTTIAGGAVNIVGTACSIVGGGLCNRVYHPFATIAGGRGNTITGGTVFNQYSFIGGGLNNCISGTVCAGTIGGGIGNSLWGAPSILLSATIGGGNNNSISGSATASTIAGGCFNKIAGLSNFAIIGGGVCNYISGLQSIIAGGSFNSIYGDYSTILGGRYNTIVTGHSNATILGDGEARDKYSFSPSSLTIDFSSGVYFSDKKVFGAVPDLNNVTANFAISGIFNGEMILANSASNITGVIASGNVTGFNTSIIQIGAGQIQITGSGIGIKIASYSNQYKTAGQFATISVLHTGSDGYIMYGNTTS